jgi:hypothetical protein
VQSYPSYPIVDNAVTIVQRRGPLGWWLALTSPPRRRDGARLPIRERETLRKAELTSVAMLVIFAFELALLSNSFADPSTQLAMVVIGVALVIVGALNRAGGLASRFASYLLPTIILIMMMLAVALAVGGLGLVWLPTYDLLVIPIFLSSLSGHRLAPWVFAAVSVAFILADYTLQPHVLVTHGGVAVDELAAAIDRYGWWVMVDRHLILCVFAALIGVMGASSVDRALQRSDAALAQTDLEWSKRLQAEISRDLLSRHNDALQGLVEELIHVTVRHVRGPGVTVPWQQVEETVAFIAQGEQLKAQGRLSATDHERVAQANVWLKHVEDLHIYLKLPAPDDPLYQTIRYANQRIGLVTQAAARDYEDYARRLAQAIETLTDDLQTTVAQHMTPTAAVRLVMARERQAPLQRLAGVIAAALQWNAAAPQSPNYPSSSSGLSRPSHDLQPSHDLPTAQDHQL